MVRESPHPGVGGGPRAMAIARSHAANVGSGSCAGPQTAGIVGDCSPAGEGSVRSAAGWWKAPGLRLAGYALVGSGRAGPGRDGCPPTGGGRLLVMVIW